MKCKKQELKFFSGATVLLESYRMSAFQFKQNHLNEQDVFWTSSICSIYILYQGGIAEFVKNLNSLIVQLYKKYF